jgi:long-chain acyl-CoA synthetase
MPEVSSISRPWLESYPPGVPQRYEYPLVGLTRFLDDAAQDFPETAALEFNGMELSYGKLLDQVDRLAGALQGLGLGRGDRVALVMTNCPQHVIALFGILRIGATAVEIDPGLETEELSRQLAEAQVRAIVFVDPVFDGLQWLLGRLPTVEHLIGTGVHEYLPFSKRVLFPLTGRRNGEYVRIPSSEGVLRLVDLIKRSAPVFVHTEIDPARDVAVMFYTGDTGDQADEPKGVMLTHSSLVANAFQGRLWIPDVQAGRERILCPVPFSTAWGLVGCLGVGTLSAATLVLTEFDGELVRRAIDQQQPSLCMATAAMYTELADAPDAADFDLSSLRVCLSHGEPLPTDVVDRVEELTGGKLRECWGPPEAGPFALANPVYGMAKSGSIGLPVTDTVCAVIDERDPSRPVPPGRRGELAIHGPQVFSGYWARASDTAAVLSGGWLLTGEDVVIDEAGYFHLVDPSPDVIRTGGGDVHPCDVEAVLLGHPKIAEAVVAGIPGFSGGELLKAYLVLERGQSATSAEIDGFCRSRLAPYQVPRRYEFRAFLPHTLPGAPMREALIAEEIIDLDP